MLKVWIYPVMVWCVFCVGGLAETSDDEGLIKDTFISTIDDAWCEGPRPARDVDYSFDAKAVSGPIANARRQPVGALSGIIVYCSAGHGWTANSTTWGTQRGLLYGVVEDMGNVDQLNFFAQYCFNAGATVVPFRPVGQQTNEVVLDNDDAEVVFSGSWYDSASTTFFGDPGDTPYRYTYIDTNSETRSVRYTPDLPCAGYYPVYGWARSGSDRVPQLYRIAYDGGESEIRVDHRRVGLGWVWLGTYYFTSGTNGYVEISNYSPGDYDSGNDVIIADAIRFGNGMGDVDQGFGVSGYPREEECARYWVQRATGQGMSSTLYDLSGYSDQDDNVGAPRRMAESMNREADGGFWDRIYLGFHSNAGSGTGRGALGLYDTRYSTAIQNRQKAFGQALFDELDNDMEWGDNGVLFNDDWTDNSIDLYGSTYGEIYGAISNEMNNTIIEVAFHDNADDANLLKDPCARNVIARSCYQAIVKHLNANNSSNVPLALLPEPPLDVQAVNVPDGVQLSWCAPLTNAASGDAASGYVVYQSDDGYGYGLAADVTNTSVVITNLVDDAVYFFQVAAYNAGGESLPSETVGVRVNPSGQAQHLVVNGFDRCDRGLAPTPYYGNNIAGNVTRVWPWRINAFDYVVQHGQAISAAGNYFDSCSHGALTQDLVRLTNYHAAYWILGEESTVDETFSSDEQALVDTFLGGNGCLFVSGAELGWDLGHLGSAADQLFLTNSLRAEYVSDDAGTYQVTGRSGTLFDGISTFNFDDGTGDTYDANYPDTWSASAWAVVCLNYGTSSSSGSGAAIQYSNGCRIVVMGFPFETIMTASARSNLMVRVAQFFGNPEEVPEMATTNILICEIMQNPESVSDTAGEWFEIYNRGTNDIDIDRWTIKDLGSDSHIIDNGGSLLVPAQDFLVMGRNADTNLNGGVVLAYIYSGITLGNTDDEIILLNASSVEVARVAYDGGPAWPDPAGASMGLKGRDLEQTNAENWATSCRVWPGGLGDLGSPGFKNQWGTWDDADADEDGMPDWWEQLYFTNGASAIATGDDDHDGLDNGAEWITGTDPTNAASVFVIDHSAAATNGFIINWDSISNRWYTIDITTNLQHGFTTLHSNLLSTPPMNVYTDEVPSATLHIYYRIRVEE